MATKNSLPSAVLHANTSIEITQQDNFITQGISFEDMPQLLVEKAKPTPLAALSDAGFPLQ